MSSYIYSGLSELSFLAVSVAEADDDLRARRVVLGFSCPVRRRQLGGLRRRNRGGGRDD
jgi:hypothetical protein